MFQTMKAKLISAALCLIMVITVLPVGKVWAETNHRTIIITEDGGGIQMLPGDTGNFQMPPETEYEKVTYGSDDSSVVSVNEDGTFVANKEGKAQITVSVFVKRSFLDENSLKPEPELLFETTYMCVVLKELSNVTISQTAQTQYMDAQYWLMPDFTFDLQCGELLNETDDTIDVSYVSSDPDNEVSGYLKNNKITLTPKKAGKTSVTITLNNIVFTVEINVIKVKLSANSLLMTAKQTKRISLKGYDCKDIKWSSSNSKVVSVSSSGVVKAKKNGNAIIKIKVGDNYLGCAVSVVSPKKKRAVEKAVRIGKTCKYSQPKRMQSKYYDCSSLVWKAYRKNGNNFGNKHYAPVAAAQGRWCALHGRLVKGGLSKANVRNMKLQAGDLMFRTGAKNSRYRGIYHVEMISGYICYGYDKNGNPLLDIKWANRPVRYYSYDGKMVGRP